jgi:hypothetical protein
LPSIQTLELEHLSRIPFMDVASDMPGNWVYNKNIWPYFVPNLLFNLQGEPLWLSGKVLE